VTPEEDAVKGGEIFKVQEVLRQEKILHFTDKEESMRF
jgi:hypothetical protein